MDTATPPIATLSTRTRLPKGPSFGAWQAFSWNRDPLRFFRERFARYGDPFTTPFMFDEPVVCTAEPDGVREIFSADPDTFDVLGSFLFEPVLGHGSLLVLAGDRHKKERRLLMPAFHGERMRAYGELMIDATRRRLAELEVGETFVAQNVTQAIALDVILRAVFGVADPERMELFAYALVKYIESANPALLIAPWLRKDLGPWSPGGRLARAGRAVDALMLEEITGRRAAPQNGDDVLGLMVAARYDDGSAMTDRELRDELVTIVLTGHETTASALAWAIHFCWRQPEVLERLRGELAELGAAPNPMAIAGLPYLDAVCQETLRLRPVIADVVRRTRRPFTLRGVELPAGVGVCAATMMTHFDERIFPQAEAFLPERFLSRRYGPHEHYPFGGGARRCIGAAFALFEMKMVLATLVSALELSRAGSGEPRMHQRNIAWGPRGGVPMRLEARRALS
jgi:cytochrome P450